MFKPIIIKDTYGNKYRLGKFFLEEMGRFAYYAMPRADLFTFFLQSNVPIKTRCYRLNRVSEFTVQFYATRRLAIGCRLFNIGTARIIRRWAQGK